MKKFLSTIILIILCLTFFSLRSQTRSYNSVSEIPNYIKPKEFPGGSKPSFYKYIDDGLYECLYLYTINDKTSKGKKFREDYYCMLNLGKSAARFTDYTVFKADSAIMGEQVNSTFRDKCIFNLKKQKYRFYADIIQGFPTGKTTYTDLVTPEYLEYYEPLGDITWELIEGADTICGYSCMKAIASYGGREWTAWFAPDIPSQFGPWKFNGLPGLILQVCDSEGIHRFTAIQFRGSKTPITKPYNELISTTTRDKFIEAKALFEKSPRKYNNGMRIQYLVNPTGEVLLNGVELPRRPNGYTPIELQ